MTEFEKQFREVQELLEFNDFNQTIKRVIDFTLDSENIDFYTKTNEFLVLDKDGSIVSYFPLNCPEASDRLLYLISRNAEYNSENICRGY